MKSCYVSFPLPAAKPVSSLGRNWESVHIFRVDVLCSLSFPSPVSTPVDSLVPKEFHIVKNRGVLPLTCFDE